MSDFDMNVEIQKIQASLAGIEINNPPLEREANCEKHGAYIQKCYYKSWTGCKSCQTERDEASRIQNERNRKEDERIKWAAILKESGMPERFANQSLSTYFVDKQNANQVRIYEFCCDYADNFSEIKKTGRSFLMLGKVGTGKTHLSVGIALQIMKNGYSAVFTSASKMLRAIKDTYRKDSDYSESDVIKKYTSCGLLIVDEVGVQRGSEYEKDMLFDVINERYESVKPTIILSNLAIDEVKLFLGERVFDRLRENGGKAFLFDWQSMRGQKNDN
jgi:DNA replication protein DnaC